MFFSKIMTYGLLVLFVLMILVMLIVVGPPPAHDLVAYLVWLQITGTFCTEAEAGACPVDQFGRSRETVDRDNFLYIFLNDRTTGVNYS